jgi:hypothetical protein
MTWQAGVRDCSDFYPAADVSHGPGHRLEADPPVLAELSYAIRVVALQLGYAQLLQMAWAANRTPEPLVRVSASAIGRAKRRSAT